MLENIRLSFQSIWSYKLRSFLTMLGIIIGIASIIIIISTIKGTNEMIKENLIGAGNNVVLVQVYQGDYAYDMEYTGNPDGVRPLDPAVQEELEALSGVDQVSLFHSRSYLDGSAYYQNAAFSGSLYGIDADYFDVYGYVPRYGRLFLPEEYTTWHKVAILDMKAASNLFQGENPIGKVIELRSEPYEIIGVVDTGNKFTPTIHTLNDYYMYADTSSGRIFVPDAAWPILYRFDEPQSVAVRATDTDAMTVAGKNVADYLTEHQIYDQTGTFTYGSEDLLKQAEQLQSMTTSTKTQLIWIAGISLLVGGIGVMNIMLVSVTERVAEIGLKKAIGAKRRRIMMQFLTEAAVLTSLGGVLGVIVGVALAKLISKIMQIPTAVSIPAILISVVFSMVIGIVFGLLPATKAAKLNPIEALRRD